MRVRLKDGWAEGTSGRFNESGLGEVIVQFDTGDMDSMFVKDLDVKLTDAGPPGRKGRDTDGWVDMVEAFAKNWLIPDNYNRFFREPKNIPEFERGWYE